MNFYRISNKADSQAGCASRPPSLPSPLSFWFIPLGWGLWPGSAGGLIFGFWVNAITGTMLLTSDVSLKLHNPDFYIKMAFIAISLILLRIMRNDVFGSPEAETGKFSTRSKMLAWASLFCWLVVIT